MKVQEQKQKDIIVNTEVKKSTDARTVSEKIVNGGNELATDKYFQYYNFYGFSFSNDEKDCLDNYPFENKFDGSYQKDNTLKKYAVENKKPAILEIPEFNRKGNFLITCTIQRKSYNTGFNVSLISEIGEDKKEKQIGSFGRLGYSWGKPTEETFSIHTTVLDNSKLFLKFFTPRGSKISILNISILELGKQL